MSSEDRIHLDGIVSKECGNGLFIIEVPGPKESTKVSCRLSGKIKQNNIKILNGDRVKIEVSQYDLTKGRIIVRYKN